MLRRLPDGSSQWQETTGTWPPGQPTVNFTYEDGWQQWQYKVVAQFQFIGSGLLMCDANARRMLYDGLNLIIDR